MALSRPQNVLNPRQTCAASPWRINTATILISQIVSGRCHPEDVTPLQRPKDQWRALSVYKQYLSPSQFRDEILSSGARTAMPRSVLIVEDEFLVRLELEQALVKAGWEIAASVGSVARALPAIATLRFDAALADVKLGDASSHGVIDTLTAEGIPFPHHDRISCRGFLPGASALHPDQAVPHGRPDRRSRPAGGQTAVLSGTPSDSTNARPSLSNSPGCFLPYELGGVSGNRLQLARISSAEEVRVAERKSAMRHIACASQNKSACFA